MARPQPTAEPRQRLITATIGRLHHPEETTVTNSAEKPAEASFYDDPATADLSAKVTQAWAEFDEALSRALPLLPAGASLELTLDPSASGLADIFYSVSVSPAADDQFLAFAVGNAGLPPEYRLSRTAVAELVALGWSPPGVISDPMTRFGLNLPASQAQRLAAIVSRTLRDIYGTPHPAFLVYTMSSEPASDAATGGEPTGGEATGADPTSAELTSAEPTSAEPTSAEPTSAAPVTFPALGAARPAEPGSTLPSARDLAAMPLRDKVLTVIGAMLGSSPDSLPTDPDGDIAIRSGSAMVFVRVRDNPPLVDVFSPVLTDVDATERLYVKLSELTHRMPIGRLYCANDTVWASVPVFGREFQPTHLMVAVQVMTGLADELDDRLHGEFGGKRFFIESDHRAEAGDQPAADGAGGESGRPNGGDGTGMYL